MKYLKKIKTVFDETGLSLTKKQGVSWRDVKRVEALKTLAPEYEQLHRGGGRISLCCQNRINDFIILIQIYYKENFVEPKKIIETKKVVKEKIVK
jgi:hypothetical protein